MKLSCNIIINEFEVTKRIIKLLKKHSKGNQVHFRIYFTSKCRNNSGFSKISNYLDSQKIIYFFYDDEFLDFSGYEIAAEHLLKDENAFDKHIFLNDTLYIKHNSSMLLKSFFLKIHEFAANDNPNIPPVLIGTQSKWFIDTAHVNTRIVPSYLFCLNNDGLRVLLSLQNLNNLTFNNSGLLTSEEERNVILYQSFSYIYFPQLLKRYKNNYHFASRKMICLIKELELNKRIKDSSGVTIFAINNLLKIFYIDIVSLLNQKILKFF